MKAILLAGGRGTRISRYIGDCPKCILDIGGIPLIRHTVLLMLKNKIKVSVVLGYNKEQVKEALEGLDVTYYYNPFYDVTNSIASLWFAKEELSEDDIIIANADVFMEQDILDVVINNEQDNMMLMDSSRDSDYLFKCQNNLLMAHGKELQGKISGEYVGLAKLNKGFVKTFNSRLIEMIGNQNHNLWWENVLYSFIGERNVNVNDIKGSFWSEIDFIEDYNRIVDYRKGLKK